MNRRSIPDRRASAYGILFILRLLAVLKKYRLNHALESADSSCQCALCCEADKLLEEGNPENHSFLG